MKIQATMEQMRKLSDLGITFTRHSLEFDHANDLIAKELIRRVKIGGNPEKFQEALDRRLMAKKVARKKVFGFGGPSTLGKHRRPSK